MFRFISFLLGKTYEPCKTCEILKQQLEIVNSEKKELIETLTNIVSPKPIITTETRKLEPTDRKFLTFTERRAALEAADRLKTQAENNKLAAKPDEIKASIEELEKELGVTDAG